MSTFSPEYQTSNPYIAYPFQENEPGLAYDGVYSLGPGVPTIPLDFIIDAAIRVPPPDYPSSDPLPVVELDSIRKLSNGNSIISLNAPGYTGTFLYYEVAPASVTGYVILDMFNPVWPMSHARFLVGETFYKYLSEIPVGTQLDLRIKFSDRVVTGLHPKVTALELKDSNTGVTHTITGAVKFKEGYNVEAKLEDTDEPDISIIRIDAAPGIGLGLHPCIEDTKEAPALGLYPDSYGNINIYGDSCVNVVTHPSSGIIELQNDCSPCCSCDDYVNAAEAVKKLVLRADQLRQDLLAFHATLTNKTGVFNISVGEESAVYTHCGGFLNNPPQKNYRYGYIYVWVVNRMFSQSITDISVSMTVDSGVEVLTVKNPQGTVALPRRHTLFSYRCRTLIKDATEWNITANVTYTYDGASSTQTITGKAVEI